ncbi:glycosyltransferase [Streptomyces prunicolor]|uniref:glycosyltransferase n=1 Tax=Streptomyces prunicolor TaxID=67348 RepID=UPI00039B1D2E|nr:glycosyltransferase [Streptomyces prunicolor]
MSRHIAILSGPYRVDDRLGGIGLRLWEIAQVLADAGHRVTIAAPYPSDFAHPGVRIVTGAESEVLDACDVVFTTDLPDTRLLLKAYERGALIVAENAPPIEHLHFDALAGPEAQDLYEDTVARWRLQLMLADHLLVRSEAELASTLGALVATGRMSAAHHRTDPGLSHLVSLVPIGYNRHSLATAAVSPQVAAGACDLLWNGGVWDYCHPSPVLDALAHLRENAPTLRLLYAPDEVRGAALEERAEDLHVADRVLWPTTAVAHRDRDGWVKAARALVITGERTAENMTCHRLRLRDAGLYRLPVVSDGYGATGHLVRALGIGPVVDPADTAALAAALRQATTEGPARTQYLASLAAVQDRFTLEHHLIGLLEFLEVGRPAPDRSAHRAAIQDLLAQRPALRHQSPAVI